MCNTQTLLVAVLLIALNPLTTASIFNPPKATIRINDALKSRGGLKLHCKDKKHDLGVQQISFEQNFNFTVQPSLMPDVLYFCAFWWDTGSNLHWFDIYVQERDMKLCSTFCDWDIHESGPCLQYPDGAYIVKCYDWNKKENDNETRSFVD